MTRNQHVQRNRTQLFSRSLIGLLLILLAGQVNAQAPQDDTRSLNPEDFSLFGEVEVNGADGEEDGGSAGRRRASSSRDSTAPDFTLVGTSRIGDRYSAILRSRDGNEVVIATEQGRNARIDGYSQFSVVDVGPGRVSLQLPPGAACVEYRDQGVSCNSTANIAVLELKRGDPLPRVSVAANQEDNPADEEGPVVVSEEPSEEPANPFAALRARALQQNGDAPLAPAASPRRAFTPRRIDPADVPPGYRVVSTPFGDRLVRE